MTDAPDPLDPLAVLRTSVRRLAVVVEPRTDDVIVEQAYPSEWTIAQVLSHLGSGAVIYRRQLAAALAGEAVPDDFAPSVWDEWNAKSPRAQATDALVADAALVAALDAVTAEERASFSFSMGPITTDFGGFVGLRLNEHALHTWDIEVALDDSTTVAADSAAVVIDNLAMLANFTAKPTDGEARTVIVETTEPERRFTIDLTAEGATLSPTGDATADADLQLPAEALIRLVYGRLDPDHTPAFGGDAALLDRLRATYPGF